MIRMLDESRKVQNINYINLALSKRIRLLIELKNFIVTLDEMNHISQKNHLTGFQIWILCIAYHLTLICQGLNFLIMDITQCWFWYFMNIKMIVQ